MHVACGSILLCRRRNKLCISGFVDDVMFARNGPRGGMSIPLQRVTSLRLHAQANIPAVPYCKRPVLDDGTRHRA